VTVSGQVNLTMPTKPSPSRHDFQTGRPYILWTTGCWR
jgi:hypothetical protein